MTAFSSTFNNAKACKQCDSSQVEVVIPGKSRRDGTHQEGRVLHSCLLCLILLLILSLLSFCFVLLTSISSSWLRACISFGITSTSNECSVEENNRFDCWPEGAGASEEACVNRGCCWQAASVPETAPWCFFPSNYNGYTVKNMTKTTSGIQASLSRSTNTFFSKDVKQLGLEVTYQTDYRLRIKFYDPTNKRYEPPLDLPTASNRVSNPQYTVSIQENPFNIVVRRASTGATIFDTTKTAPLIFSDQYLQIATQFSTRFVYGLGEHRERFLQDLESWKRLVFWNFDNVPTLDKNGYGAHPFFMNLETEHVKENGTHDAHGVVLVNSNAGEVAFQPFGPSRSGAVTYRFLGGVLDFFLLLGPEPLSVASQLTEVIGRPYFPPFWSLGFHLCRWGYNTSDVLKKVIKRNRDANIPYDVQWNDIDYMEGNRDWTYSKTNFPDLPEIVDDLHQNQQRYILMTDPVISSTQPPGTYPPFDLGKELDVLIKHPKGGILIGKLWPGLVAFPDFFHPNAVTYWLKLADEFRTTISYDGFWIDMNEPTNFAYGSVTGCTDSSLDNPPYVPPTTIEGKLPAKTLCPSAYQTISTHFNLHNMYGWSQANVSRTVLNYLLPNKRSLMITRSSFLGSGKLTGLWLGDNSATYDDMIYSIPGVLSFNLFGIHQVGADVCGFKKNTTPELCTRWHQLGAFYPFMRNHADMGPVEQDPAAFEKPYQDYIRSAIEIRYRLLAVLYTAFYKSHTLGLPIFRPLFYMFPGTESIENQFMWTDQILVSPVVTQGMTSVQAFIPLGLWYDFHKGAQIVGSGEYITLDAPLDHINIHIRGGSILPLLPVTQRTDEALKQNLEVVAAPDSNGFANGDLFRDDGESADSVSAKKFSLLQFTLDKNTFTSIAKMAGYKPDKGLKLRQLTILGVVNKPGKVVVSGKETDFTYDDAIKVLTVANLDVDLLQKVQVSWS